MPTPWQPIPAPTGSIRPGPGPTPRPGRSPTPISYSQPLSIQFSEFQKPGWSADSKLLAVQESLHKFSHHPNFGEAGEAIFDQQRLLNLDEHDSESLLPENTQFAGPFYWHPSLPKLLYRTSSTLRIYDAKLKQVQEAQQEVAGWNYTWSGDGKQFAAVSYGADGLYRFKIQTLDSSFSREIASLSRQAGDIYGLTWTPDDQGLAYIRDLNQATNQPSIYVLNLEGQTRSITPILTSPYAQSILSFQWSPDGKKLAFVMQRGVLNDLQTGVFPQQQLYLANADGSEAKVLSELRRIDKDFAWSPDSRYVVVSNGINENHAPDGSELHVIEATSGKARAITSTDNGLDLIHNIQPAWSPDGNWIAFSSNRTTRFGAWRRDVYDVFRIHPDGTGIEQLTQASYLESS